MSGFKRDREGNPKRVPKPVVVSAYTPMFQTFRDELDEHHDRRQRLGQASRDVTGLSKKIIFSLQRVREIGPELPEGIVKDINGRLAEISNLLALIAAETQGINRYRYGRSLSCMEELIEALTFAHYLKTQKLVSYDALATEILDLTQSKVPEVQDQGAADAPQLASAEADAPAVQRPGVGITTDDYFFGLFDLTGEMMRFATTTSALTGSMAGADEAETDGRTILQDMQDLGSFFEMLPQRRDNTWAKKLEVLRQSVRKVERLGYDRTVRGSERPAGWVPDMNAGDDLPAEGTD